MKRPIFLGSRLGFGGSRSQVEAIEESLERGVIELDMRSVDRGHLRQLEGATVEALVEEAQARAVEEENLRRVTTLSQEDEEGAGTRLIADALTDEASKTLEREPHVDRFGGEEDLDARGDHGFSERVQTTERRRSGSKPLRTRRRTGPSSRRSSSEDGRLAATT